jgi:hypothetical protein
MLKKWLASLGHETSDHKLLCFNSSIIADALIDGFRMNDRLIGGGWIECHIRDISKFGISRKVWV